MTDDEPATAVDEVRADGRFEMMLMVLRYSKRLRRRINLPSTRLESSFILFYFFKQMETLSVSQ